MERLDCLLYVTPLEAGYLLSLLHRRRIPRVLADEQPLEDLRQRGFLQQDAARQWTLTFSGWAVAVALDAMERDKTLLPEAGIGAHEHMSASETRH
jgi:hypothetical protein